MLVQSVQLMAVGRSLSVTLWMRTEYHMSGSTSVTSREKGAIHKILTEVPYFAAFTFATAATLPIVSEDYTNKQTNIATNTLNGQYYILAFISFSLSISRYTLHSRHIVLRSTRNGQ